MQPPLLSDAFHLTRALGAYSPAAREAILRLWIDQTRAAAKYRRRFQRPHPIWGDGSLTSRALKEDARAARAADEGADFFRALSQVAHHLAGVGQTCWQSLS